MVDERNQFFYSPQGRVERNLVQVFDHDVVVVCSELGHIIAASKERVRLAIPDTVYIDSVQSHPRQSALPRAAEKIHAVTARDYATEDFSEVKLGSARLRILVVLPVQNKYPH